MQSIFIFNSKDENSQPLVEFLNGESYPTVTFTSFDKLLLALEKNPSFLIINDSDGTLLGDIKPLQKIRTLYPALPVILISDESEIKKLVEITNCGIIQIHKTTINIDTLLNTISLFLQNSKEGASTTTKKDMQIVQTEHIKSLPPLSSVLSNLSLLSKKRIQHLWNLFQTHNFLFIEGSQGFEFDLILKEIAAWSGQHNRRTLIIEANQLTTPETKQTLDQLYLQENFSTVIGIHSLASASEIVQKNIINFITSAFKKINQGTSITYVFSLLPDTQNSLIDSIKPIIKESYIKILPISQRIADIAHYIQHELAERAKKENWPSPVNWSPEALRLILDYSWPNNYRELCFFIDQISLLKNKAMIDPSTVAKILKIEPSKKYLQPQSLKDFIATHQSTSNTNPSVSNDVKKNIRLNLLKDNVN